MATRMKPWKHLSEPLVRKSLTFYKWLMLGFVAVSFFTSFIFCTVSILMASNRQNELEAAKKTYGKYYYSTSDIDLSVGEKLLSESWIDEYCIVDEIDYWVILDNSPDKQSVRFIYADDNFWEMTNYVLVRGEMPKTPDEVVVPERYMASQGYSIEEMTGKTVAIYDCATDRYICKTVSGVSRINWPDVTVDIDNRQYFVFHRDENKAISEVTKVFFTVSPKVMSSNFAKSHFFTIGQSVEEKNGKYEVTQNEEVMFLLGYTEMGQKEVAKTIGLYVAISATCIFLGAVLTGNIVALAMDKWKEHFDILNMLGASGKKVNFTVNSIIVSRIVLGEILGCAASLAGMNIIGRRYFEVVSTPVTMIAICLIIELCACIIALFRYKTNNSGEVQKQVYSSIFDKGIGRIIRYAFRNFIFYNRKKAYNILIIAVSMVVVFVLLLQYDQSEKKLDNNDRYDYYVDIKDYFNIKGLETTSLREELILTKETADAIIDYCQKQNIVPYYSKFHQRSYKLDKKNMSPEMIESITKTASGASALGGSSGRVSTELCIIGCSKEAFAEMGVHSIKENEAIILSRMINRKDTNVKTLKAFVGETLSFVTILRDEELNGIKADFTIVDETDILQVCPLIDKNHILLMVDIDTYNDYFNNGLNTSFYIKNLTKEQYDAIRIMTDETCWIQIINQKEIKADILKAERTKHIVVTLVLILCCIYCFVNIETQQSLENKLREGENELLTNMGVSRKLVIAERSFENSLVYILGGVLGLLLIFVFYEVMFEIGVANNQMAISIFVLESLLIITIFTASSFMVDFLRLWKFNKR